MPLHATTGAAAVAPASHALPSLALTGNISASAYYASPGTNITFNGYASGGSPPYSWYWYGPFAVVSTTENLSVVYPDVGVFPIYLNIHDSAGGNITVEVNVTIANYTPPPLSASFTASNLTGPLPVYAGFYATASGGTSPYLWYNWTFGDGSTYTGGEDPSAMHIFDAYANYTVTLQVTDSSFQVASYTSEVTVAPASTGNSTGGGAVVLSLTSNILSSGLPATVDYVEVASGATGPYNFLIEFDALTMANETSGEQVSATFDSTYTYTESGPYTVIGQVWSADGSEATATLLVNISSGGTSTPPGCQSNCSAVPAPSVTIPSAVIAGDTATFVGRLSATTGTYTLDWSFGDGTSETTILTAEPGTTTEVTVTHTYARAGLYTLTVTDEAGTGSVASTYSVTVGTSASSAKLSWTEEDLPIALVAMTAMVVLGVAFYYRNRRGPTRVPSAPEGVGNLDPYDAYRSSYPAPENPGHDLLAPAPASFPGSRADVL